MLVIIGLGTAGIYAAKWATRTNRNEEITIIEKRGYETYSPCSIPLVVEGAVDIKHIIHPFPKTKKINVLLNHEATEIDSQNKRVIYKNLENGEVNEIEYDKLIFAGGAKPFVPPIKGADRKGVFTVRVVEDAENILNYANQSRSALIIGAGAIGIEMAYALKKRGLEVTVAEMLEHPFPKSLDRDMAKIVEEHLKEEGIKCMCSARVEEITGKEKVDGAIINGEHFDFDMVIVSAGVKPTTGILQDKVKTDKGFIVVDEKMQTSVKDIFAAGDCVITPYGTVQLATVAARQGAVAGINAAGGDAIYTGHTAAFVSAIGEFEIASVGTKGAISGRGRATITPYSQHSITLKIFADTSGKITGAQAVGYRAAHKIDVVSAIMRKGGYLWDLAFMEHAYCPACSQLYDALKIAAENAMRRLKIEKYEI